MTWPAGTARAIARSLDIYYRDTARVARMDRLNARFVRPGDLTFDLGAHLGDRTASFRRLGATVVAVEPQAAVFRALRLIFGRDRGVHLHQVAVGAVAAQMPFFVNSANPTVSTASRALVAAAPQAAAWQDQIWDHVVETKVVTLDDLIATHGRPGFVKIDVEGQEAEVLRGLSQPLPALSFEFTTLQRTVATDALDLLMRLGPYRFNYARGETHDLALPDWVAAAEIDQIVRQLPDAANSGDIYAVLDPD